MVLTLEDRIRSPLRLGTPIFGEVVSDPIGVEIGTPTPVPTSISLTTSASEVVAGGTVNFTGQVLDQNGNPMSGITITLIIHQGQETQDSPRYIVTTQDSLQGIEGLAMFSQQHTFPQAGTFYAEANYQTKFMSNRVTVVVAPIPATPSALTLDASPLSVIVGDKVSFTGALTDQNGNPIADHPVYIDVYEITPDTSAGVVLRTTLTNTTEPQSGTYWNQYAFNSAGSYRVQARAPQSMAFGVMFPETEAKTIKVYERGEQPRLPEWVLPAVGVGAVATIAALIALWRVKK